MTDDLEKSLADAFHILNMYYNEEVYEQALEYGLRIRNKFEPHLDASHEKLFDLYIRLGILYGFNGMHAEQLEITLKASDMFQDQIKDNPEKTQALYNNLITAYKDLHFYSEAMEWVDKTMEFYKENPDLFTKEHELEMSGTMADLYRWTGQDEKAIEYYLKTNEIYVQIFGRKHEGIAHNFRLIARIHAKNGQNTKALAWLLKSLSVLEKLPNRDCPGMVFTQSALAQQYEVMHQPAKASEFLAKMKAAFDREGKLTKVSRIVLAAHICNILLLKGEHKQALEWQQKAVSMAEKYYGKENPNTAIEYNNLGEVYSDMKNYNMAIKNYIKAFNVREKLYGYENEETFNALTKLGCIYAKAGNHAKAEESLLLAIQHGEKMYGEDNKDKLLFAYITIARDYAVAGNNDEAEKYFIKVLDIQESFADRLPPKNITDSLRLIAQFYMQKQDYDTALHYANVRLEMILKTHNKENNQTLFAICEVAKCYCGMKDFDKSIELYLQVIRCLIARYGLQNEHCEAVFAELALTHKMAGIEEEFAPWFIRQIKDVPLHKVNRKRKK